MRASDDTYCLFLHVRKDSEVGRLLIAAGHLAAPRAENDETRAEAAAIWLLEKLVEQAALQRALAGVPL